MAKKKKSTKKTKPKTKKAPAKKTKNKKPKKAAKKKKPAKKAAAKKKKPAKKTAAKPKKKAAAKKKPAKKAKKRTPAQNREALRKQLRVVNPGLAKADDEDGNASKKNDNGNFEEETFTFDVSDAEESGAPAEVGQQAPDFDDSDDDDPLS